MDPPSLKKYYAPVTVNASTYFENAVSMSRFEVDLEWSALGKPVDRNQWFVIYRVKHSLSPKLTGLLGT